MCLRIFNAVVKPVGLTIVNDVKWLLMLTGKSLFYGTVVWFSASYIAPRILEGMNLTGWLSTQGQRLIKDGSTLAGEFMVEAIGPRHIKDIANIVAHALDNALSSEAVKKATAKAQEILSTKLANTMTNGVEKIAADCAPAIPPGTQRGHSQPLERQSEHVPCEIES